MLERSAVTSSYSQAARRLLVSRYRRCTHVSTVRSLLFFFFSSRRRHTRLQGDWSSDVCSSDLFLNSPGDEMKDGPAFHRDRCARVVRQHEHRHVIRRVLAPPAAPPVVGPRPAYGAEHVSAHDIRTDAFPEALGKIVVGTRRPARFAVYLAKRARAD